MVVSAEEKRWHVNVKEHASNNNGIVDGFDTLCQLGSNPKDPMVVENFNDNRWSDGFSCTDHVVSFGWCQQHPL